MAGTQADDIENTDREIAEAALAAISRALNELRQARYALLVEMLPIPEEGSWRAAMVTNVAVYAAVLAETAGYLGLRAAGRTVVPRRFDEPRPDDAE